MRLPPYRVPLLLNIRRKGVLYAMLSPGNHAENTMDPRKKTKGQEEKNKPEGRLNIKITT